jgi:hypothetical protein
MRVFGSRLTRRLEWSCVLVLGLAALASGCSTSDNIIYGTPVITIGDVSGDFTSYIVEIDEITFTRSDGLVVEPLATPEQVDLSKLTNMSELLEAPAFPYGTYTSMTLILDYTAVTDFPAITVNVNGTVETVTPLDTTGAPMLTQSVTVNFDPQHPLVISPNQSTAFAIDIDLAAMNTLNLSASPITAIVQPFVSASVLPVAETGTIRARGLVVVADPSSHYYIMNIRPFADLISALGALQVNTSATTYFNINGNVYVGAPGLQAMTAANIVNTPAVAYGTLDDLSGITPTFNATSVLVGSIEESTIADFLTGTVSAVNGDALTVQGVSYLNRDGELGYYGQIPVTLNAATPVYADGVSASGLTQASISVGQQVTIAGQSNLNATTGNLESFDATNSSADTTTNADTTSGSGGIVRLQPTQLWGTLNSATTGSVSLDLLSIDNFEPSDFNFAGTGSSTSDDAVASSYLVDTGSLNESALPAGTLLQVNGLVTPLRSAPPDFTASSIAQASAVPATIVFEFGSTGAGVVQPFLQLTSAGIIVDLASADSVHYIQTGPTRINLTTQAQVPLITFAAGTTLILATGEATTEINVFNEISGFITQVNEFQVAGDLVYRLVCLGQYSAATNSFIANKVDVAFEE